jgi:hypothetical protein
VKGSELLGLTMLKSLHPARRDGGSSYQPLACDPQDLQQGELRTAFLMRGPNSNTLSRAKPSARQGSVGGVVHSRWPLYVGMVVAPLMIRLYHLFETLMPWFKKLIEKAEASSPGRAGHGMVPDESEVFKVYLPEPDKKPE